MPSKEPWKQWEKPWSRSQCEQRYVQGEKAGLRALATESGQPKGTIERWCKADDWVGRRGQFHDSLRTKTQEKTLEKVSDSLSDVMSDLTLQHLECHREIRQMVMKRLFLLGESIEGDINLKELNTLSLVLSRHIEGERRAAFLDNLDLDKALSLVLAVGYKISSPGESEEKLLIEDESSYAARMTQIISSTNGNGSGDG